MGHEDRPARWIFAFGALVSGAGLAALVAERNHIKAVLREIDAGGRTHLFPIEIDQLRARLSALNALIARTPKPKNPRGWA